MPIPMTTTYKARLVRGLMRAWSAGKPAHNPAIMITRSRSMLNLTRPLAVKRAETLPDIVARLAGNAEGAERCLPNWDAACRKWAPQACQAQASLLSTRDWCL